VSVVTNRNIRLFIIYIISTIGTTFPVTPGLEEQIVYNDSLVTRTVVSLFAAKFKLLVFSVHGFAFSFVLNG